jgi:hypothetical protein
MAQQLDDTRPVTRAKTRAKAPEVPQPASGIDLIGEYEASGYREPPCLVRRADGSTPPSS